MNQLQAQAWKKEKSKNVFARMEDYEKRL